MAKSKKNNKKKTKKNSNYKNQVVEKNVPKKSEKNLREAEKKAKLKDKQKKKDEKALAKQQKALEKQRKKEEKKNLKSKKEAVKETKKEIIPVKEPVEEKKEIPVVPEIKEELTEKIPEAKEETTEEISESVEESADETTEEIPAAEEVPEEAEETLPVEEENTESVPTVVIEEVAEEIAEEIQPEEIPEEKTGVVIEEVSEEKVEETKQEIIEIKEKKQINLPKIDLKKIKFTKKNIIIALVAVVTLAALISVLSVVNIGKTDYSPSVYGGRNFADDEVGVIAISQEQQEEFIKNTKAKGNTRKFSFYANTAMEVSKPDSLLPVSIANPSTSEEILLCTIVNENGVIVYRSLGIIPGRYVSNVRLSQYLDYGKNELTLYVSAFKAEGEGDTLTYKKLGTQTAEIEVTVGDDYMSE